MKYSLYNNEMCPKIWIINEDGPRLDDGVRNGLLKIAQDFVKDLKENNDISIKIYDVVIIGSIANYNWTNYSDIDLHIVTDYKDLDMDADTAQTLFDSIKVAWNGKHDIKMKGFDVEIYVQNKDHVAVSSAEYSVLNNKWNKEPKKEDPKFDKELIKKKYKEYKEKINSLIKKHDESELKKLLEKLYKFRQAGLDAGGELSEENIVFKILRAYGHLDKLKDSINKIYDKKMSVNESVYDVTQFDEAIDAKPNGTLLWTDDEPGLDLVLTDDEDTDRVHTFNKIPVFGAYEISKEVAQSLKADADPKDMKEDMKKFRKAIKHPKDADSIRIMNELIDTSIRRLFSQINMNEVSVIIPLGSSSNLNLLVAKKIQEKLPNVVILEDVLKKSTWKDVQLSPTWEREMGYEKVDGVPRLGPRDAKKTLELKKKNHSTEVFQVQQLRRGMRRYYSMFYHTDEGKVVDATKLLKGVKVLLIDDTLEEGATMNEAIRVVRGYEPKEILGYIFLWGRGSDL